MTISIKIIEEIEKEAKKYFKGASGCHDWSHVERVKNLALRIGKIEKANLELLEVAVLLHDIGRRDEMKAQGAFCHAIQSGKIARKILPKYGFNQKTINEIAHCIEAHRYRNDIIPNTIEANVLYDADKLDSIGAIGIGRAFLFAGNAGSNVMYNGKEKELAKNNKNYTYHKDDSAVLEYEVKLKNIKNKILTKEGKRMAITRHKFMENFFTTFWQEIEGKK
ncbi:MAG: HD domain-containing protein [Candidatus Pacebacteria bacterium]|nr:HD domain-containing protein [Candidatus Paceibacterota bacterium]